MIFRLSSAASWQTVVFLWLSRQQAVQRVLHNALLFQGTSKSGLANTQTDLQAAWRRQQRNFENYRQVFDAEQRIHCLERTTNMRGIGAAVG